MIDSDQGESDAFDWNWPSAIDRPLVESILSLDFVEGARNVVLVAPGGLGKTMIAQNIAHRTVLAGRSVLFLSAAQLLLDLGAQESARALDRRLHSKLEDALADRRDPSRRAAEADDASRSERRSGVDPEIAEAHYLLGVCLGEVDAFYEGIAECDAASRLRPEWDAPRIHAAVILMNADRAIVKLLDVSRRRGESSRPRARRSSS